MLHPPSTRQQPLQFGEGLRARRAHLRLSQGEVAARAGISVNYLSLLENDKRTPSFETLEALARALGSTVWYFVSEAEPVPEHLSPKARRLSTDLRDLIRRLQEALDHTRPTELKG